MKIKVNLYLTLLVLGVFMLGISTRFVSSIPNVTAIGAIALASGAFFSNRKYALLLPLLILFISDAILGFHVTMPFVYASILLISVLGFSLRKKKHPLAIAGLSISGSLLFYLITNFGVWLTGMGLSSTLSGVYIDGLPFLRNMALGDLAFNAVLFGIAYLIAEKNLQTSPQDVH